jgi:hypothetical protein
MSGIEGTIFQRGPQGQIPTGMSINGVPGAPGTILVNGQPAPPEHVTMYGPGWHRSWDNPGTTVDHSTIHATRQVIPHSH